MSNFLVRRLISIIPVLFGILLVTFILGRSIPGDPCTAMLAEKANPETCAAFEERFGLNEPIYVQFGIYIRDIFKGDLGQSLNWGRPVTELLAERLPVTIELTVLALFFATLVGVPIGILAAYRRNSSIDVGVMLTANAGISMPVFWLGIMLAYLFGVVLKDSVFALPPGGRLTPGLSPEPFYTAWGLIGAEDTPSSFLVFIARFNILNAVFTLNFELFIDAIKHLLLPAVAVGTIPLAVIARMTRSSLVEVLNQDYIRTARAKGLMEKRVIFTHGARNALLPVVTIIGLNFGFLVSGAVLTETIFSLTGIGKTLFEGITARDYAVIQGVTLSTSLAFVVINLIVDVLYGYLDPRIRLG